MTNDELLDALIEIVTRGSGEPPLEAAREMRKDADRWTCLPLLDPMDIATEVMGAQMPQDLRRGLERRVDALIDRYKRDAAKGSE